MDPARESEPRSNAHDELDAILREADAIRRRSPGDLDAPDDEDTEPRPRLNIVEGLKKENAEGDARTPLPDLDRPPVRAPLPDLDRPLTRTPLPDLNRLEPKQPAEARTPPPALPRVEPKQPAEGRTPPPALPRSVPKKTAEGRTPPPDLRRFEPKRPAASEPRRTANANAKRVAAVRALPGLDDDDSVRFELIDKQLSDPGEQKFKTFQLPMHGVLVLMLGIGAVAMWALSPNGAGFLKPAPLPASYLDASARWAMVLTAERIDRFRQEKQRLPEDLAELGPLGSELISYERLSDGQYRVQAPGTDRPLSLGAATPREVFAAQSIDILRVGPDKAP